MPRHIPIASLIAAVAATVIAVAAGGAGLAAFVVLLAPLPVMLAGLSFGWRSAVLVGIGAAIGLAAAAGISAATGFALAAAAPSVLLSYLALLNRPLRGEEPANIVVEWYPPGRLVVAAALMASLFAVVVLWQLGADAEAVRHTVKAQAGAWLTGELTRSGAENALSPAEIETLSDEVADRLPAGLAVMSMATVLFDLWLAGRLARATGDLRRPWPDLAALTFPRGTPVLFVSSMIAGVVLDGLPGLMGQSFAAAFFAAYLFLGLAVAHYVTRGWPWRRPALVALYVTLVMTPLIAPLLAILGLADSIIPLRRPPAGLPGRSLP